MSGSSWGKKVTNPKNYYEFWFARNLIRCGGMEPFFFVVVQIENLIHKQIMLNWLLILCFNVGQIVNLHYMLSKAVIKAKPNVLWCYKDKLELSRLVLPVPFIFFRKVGER